MKFELIEQQYIEKHQQQFAAPNEFGATNKQQAIMGANQFQGQVQNQPMAAAFNGPQPFQSLSQQVNQAVASGSSTIGSPSGQGRKMPPTPRTQSRFMPTGAAGSPMNQQQQTIENAYDQQYDMQPNVPANIASMHQFNPQQPQYEDKQLFLQQQQRQQQQLQQNNQMLQQQMQPGQVQLCSQFEKQVKPGSKPSQTQPQQMTNRGVLQGPHQQPMFDQKQLQTTRQQPQPVNSVRTQPNQQSQTHSPENHWQQPKGMEGMKGFLNVEESNDSI